MQVRIRRNVALRRGVLQSLAASFEFLAQVVAALCRAVAVRVVDGLAPLPGGIDPEAAPSEDRRPSDKHAAARTSTRDRSSPARGEPLGVSAGAADLLLGGAKYDHQGVDAASCRFSC
jgi:hypothetical protein